MVSINDNDIKRVIDLLKSNDLQEIEVHDGKKKVRVVANFKPFPAEPDRQLTAQTSAPSTPVKAQAPAPGITAPLVGTVYLAPAPDEPAFVCLGQRIKKGQTVCLIEAMKTFNHIQSQIDAEIVDICVENGETVEFGQPLFILAEKTS